MKPVIIILVVVFVIGLGLALNVSAEEGLIPSWIKNTASFWVDGNVEDSEFISALQYLLNEGILVIPSEQTEEIDTSQLTVQELKKQSVSLDYKDILRNEDYYVGKIIYLKGEIFRVDERDDGLVLLYVYTRQSEYGNSWLDDLMYIWYDGSRLLDNDIIEAYIVVDEVLVRETQYGDIFTPIGTAIHVTCTNC